MNKDTKTLYTLSAIFIAAVLLVSFVPNNTVSNVSLAILCLASAVCFSLFVKKRSVHAIEKKQLTLLMVAIAVIALTIYYISGIHFGFRRQLFPLHHFWKNFLPYAVAVISAEVVRSIILDQKKKKLTIIFYFVFVLLDVSLFTGFDAFTSFKGFTELVSLVLFPSLAANFMYHGLSAKYGRGPVIAYRAIVSLYPYVLPVVPNMSQALLAFLRVCLPALVYLLVIKMYSKRRFSISKRATLITVIATSLLIVILTTVVMLVSCQFRYGMLVIGSESMTGEMNKGDAVIYKQYEGEIIEKEQVILFDKNGTRVIHRVVDIQKINGVTRYYTKGDANEIADDGYITDSNIVGTAKLTIRGIGYPTVWIRSLFKK